MFPVSAFKYCCRARGEKLEKNNLKYALLARVVRDGGFKVALIARLSAIPSHFTTVVFSTCGASSFCNSCLTSQGLKTCNPGMGIFVFVLAAVGGPHPYHSSFALIIVVKIFSLPKKFSHVYIGVLLEQSGKSWIYYLFFLGGTFH